MSASPVQAVAAAAAPSQKRPLEEPSSPNGVTDQPEAKRPALEKPEEGAAVPVAGQGETPSTNGAVRTDAVKAEPTDGQGDTVVPDAPPAGMPSAAQVLETKPVQSASTTGADAGQAQASFPPQDETRWLHLRSIISSAEAATVIGKGGENVTLIRRMSGAKCTVSDYSRGAVERILTVSGLVDAVAKAFGLIIRTLNNEKLEESSTSESKTYPLRLLIPHILIGSIIGKAGQRIREIQDASGARLNASETTLPLSTERSLVVLGVADAVHIATFYVGTTLVEQLTDRFGGPAASAYAARGGGAAGVVPGGMQVVPYVSHAAGGQWGAPETFRRQQGQRPPPNAYGMPQGYGQPAQPHAPAPVHYGAGSPRQSYAGAGPQPPTPYAGHATQPHAGHAAVPQAMPHGMIPGQALTQQIFIPNDMVGAIIGKGGQKINEIRQLSNSVIKINEPQDNSNERLVTITGTQECNQMALFMLYSRLGQVQAGQK